MQVKYITCKYPYGFVVLLFSSWWRHQMETFSTLLAICAGNSPVPVELPARRSGSRSFDIFFDLRPNKQLNKQLWGWWFETPSWSLWRHRIFFLWLHHMIYLPMFVRVISLASHEGPPSCSAGHQLDEPMGFSGGLGQQLLMLYFV